MSERSVAVDAWEALFRAQVNVLRALSCDFPADGVSFGEYDLLFNLSRQPDRTLRIRDLNRHLLLSQPSVSRMVARLAERGLVERLHDPADGRGTLVTLTDEGAQVFRGVAARHADSIARRVGGALDTDELRELTELCDKLRTQGGRP